MFYHGTARKHLRKIIKTGLNTFSYVTTTPQTAARYAWSAGSYVVKRYDEPVDGVIIVFEMTIDDVMNYFYHPVENIPHYEAKKQVPSKFIIDCIGLRWVGSNRPIAMECKI